MRFLGTTARLRGGAVAVAVLLAGGVARAAAPVDTAARPEERFREANRLVQAGDVARGIETYRELAGAGLESAALYWNWSQTASTRSALGEALWALLRARELDPADAAIQRELERLKQAANLDAAELSPVPLEGLGRVARRFHLGFLAVLLLGASVAFHAASRLLRLARWPVAAAWITFVTGCVLAAVPVLASFTQPTGVVVRRGAPLLDAASPTGVSVGTLREGEVVPVLGTSGAYVRLQDSSGARGWASCADVWRLDRPPAAPREHPTPAPSS